MAKRKQKQTLKEFKAWLQGVEELQPDNWAPNRDQWQLIRARINGIIEEKIVVEKAAPIRNNSNQGIPVPQQQTTLPMMAPPVSGGVPNGQAITMTPAAKAMLNPEQGQKGKTPDVDVNAPSPFE